MYDVCFLIFDKIILLVQNEFLYVNLPDNNSVLISFNFFSGECCKLSIQAIISFALKKSFSHYLYCLLNDLISVWRRHNVRFPVGWSVPDINRNVSDKQK